MSDARKIESSISGRVKISLIAVFFVTVSYLFVDLCRVSCVYDMDRDGHVCVAYENAQVV